MTLAVSSQLKPSRRAARLFPQKSSHTRDNPIRTSWSQADPDPRVTRRLLLADGLPPQRSGRCCACSRLPSSWAHAQSAP